MSGVRRNPYLDSLAVLDQAANEDTGRLPDRAEIFIGGRDWTRYTQDLQVENSGDEGGTTTTFLSRKPLDNFMDADVRVFLDGEPYFVGTLKRPGQDGGSRWEQTAMALGPFAEMAGQSFTEQVSYTGKTLRLALLDVFSRAYSVSGIGDVIGGEHITIVEADYVKENSLSEGARGLTEPSNFVLLDQQNGQKIAMRRPRPGTSGESIRHYTPSDYEGEGGFTVDWTATQPFVKVNVFRRNEANGYDVDEWAPVEVSPSRKPLKNRIWYVPDWPGTALAGKEEAYQIASELMQMAKFSLTVRLEKRPWRWDRFTVDRDREAPEGLVTETFRVVAADSISASFAEETMTLSGDALLRRTERAVAPLGVPESLLDTGSPYLAGVA